MRLFKGILACAIMCVALFATGCDKGGEEENTKRQNMAVTYYTIDGVWMLQMWNGAPLAEGKIGRAHV